MTNWLKTKGGSWKALTPEQKKKAIVRQYVNNRIRRGKIGRKPCEVCGKTPTQTHHLDYLPRTLNIQWLCAEHHILAERAKRAAIDTFAVMP